MSAPFMVTVVVFMSSVGGWFEDHRQYHDIYECRLAVARMLSAPEATPNTKVLKRYCQNEAYGPNYAIIHHPVGESEIKIFDYKVY